MSSSFILGPLTYKRRSTGRTYAVGVVSFDSGKCGDPKYPGVYARITSELKWIKDKMHNPGYRCPE